MLKLAKVFDQKFLSSIYRNYVSIINIKADTLKSIKVIPDEYENSFQELEIKVEAIDGDKNLIKLNESNSKITKTKDEFHLEWLDNKEDTAIIVEVPLSAYRDIELNVNIKTKGDIRVSSVPSSRAIELFTGEGKIKLVHIRSENFTASGSDISADNVYAMVMDFKVPMNEDRGKIKMESCQAELLRAVGKIVSLDSCYTNNVNVKTSQQCYLKNLHGNAKANASGEVFNTVGFTGTLNADISCKNTMLHFAQLMDENNIKINHPEAFVRAGFANEIVKETTDLFIESNCPIQTKSKEFVVCHKAENEYEIIRKNPHSDSSLNMNIKNAKEVHIIKQSWIDSIKFDF